MQILIDTTNFKEMSIWQEAGFVNGFLSHSLIHNQGLCEPSFVQDVTQCMKGCVHVNVYAQDTQNIVNKARVLHKQCPRIIAQMPITTDSLKACQILQETGIPVNITLCFSVAQVLLAQKAMARYVTTCLSCLQKHEPAYESIIFNMSHVCRGTGAEFIVAGVRSVADVEMLAQYHIEHVALPPHILQEMLWHKVTDQNLAAFVEESNVLSAAS